MPSLAGSLGASAILGWSYTHCGPSRPDFGEHFCSWPPAPLCLSPGVPAPRPPALVCCPAVLFSLSLASSPAICLAWFLQASFKVHVALHPGSSLPSIASLSLSLYLPSVPGPSPPASPTLPSSPAALLSRLPPSSFLPHLQRLLCPPSPSPSWAIVTVGSGPRQPPAPGSVSH